MCDFTPVSTTTPGKTHNIYFLHWSEFAQIIHFLSEVIQADGSPQVIVGLQRGGLIPAVYLSHQLKVRQFVSLPINRTASDAIFANKFPPSVHMQPDLLRAHFTEKDVLVVDDVVGTGESIREVLRLLAPFAPTRLRTAVCIFNRANWDSNSTTEILTYIGKEVYGWVIFPWEAQPICPTKSSHNSGHIPSSRTESP